MERANIWNQPPDWQPITAWGFIFLVRVLLVVRFQKATKTSGENNDRTLKNQAVLFPFASNKPTPCKNIRGGQNNKKPPPANAIDPAQTRYLQSRKYRARLLKVVFKILKWKQDSSECHAFPTLFKRFYRIFFSSLMLYISGGGERGEGGRTAPERFFSLPSPPPLVEVGRPALTRSLGWRAGKTARENAKR